MNQAKKFWRNVLCRHIKYYRVAICQAASMPRQVRTGVVRLLVRQFTECCFHIGNHSLLVRGSVRGDASPPRGERFQQEVIDLTNQVLKLVRHGGVLRNRYLAFICDAYADRFFDFGCTTHVQQALTLLARERKSRHESEEVNFPVPPSVLEVPITKRQVLQARGWYATISAARAETPEKEEMSDPFSGGRCARP